MSYHNRDCVTKGCEGECLKRTRTTYLCPTCNYTLPDGAEIAELIEAALNWFRSKRSRNMTEEHHVEQWQVNCVGESDTRLAKAAARVVAVMSSHRSEEGGGK